MKMKVTRIVYEVIVDNKVNGHQNRIGAPTEDKAYAERVAEDIRESFAPREDFEVRVEKVEETLPTRGLFFFGINMKG